MWPGGGLVIINIQETITDMERIFHGPIHLTGHDPFSIDERVLKELRRKYQELRKKLHYAFLIGLGTCSCRDNTHSYAVVSS